jgi:hypothetical protein
MDIGNQTHISSAATGKGHPASEKIMSQKTGKVQTPNADEISAHMRALAEKRWKRSAERVASGEITADNYVYRPRGPMSPHSKDKQDLTRWERQIANAQFVRFALDGRKAEGGQRRKYVHLLRRRVARFDLADEPSSQARALGHGR